MSFTEPSNIVVTCMKWFAPYLRQEVESLGFQVSETFVTGIVLKGTLNDCIRLNLNLRCASQVLFSLGKFKADHPDTLYRTLIDIPWEESIPSDGYLSVTSNVRHPSVNNSMYINVRVKDAVADRIRTKTGHRPDSGPSMEQSVVHLFWKDEDAEIFLDTSGPSLAKHGYRKLPGKAPMMEALVSATLMATTWDQKSPFINPMCGTGTVVIEAALMATHCKPGLFRDNYAFMHILGYDEKTYRQEMDILEQQETDGQGLTFIATDHDAEAIEMARKNARMAGVENLIQFEVCPFEKTTIPPVEGGVIYINPEYGERLGEVEKLKKTYEDIGDFFKQKCQGYTGYIFTGNLDLAGKIGLKAKRRIEFFNGPIDCRLLEYPLYQGSRRKPTETII